VAKPSAIDAERRLRESFALDRLWRETVGLPPGDTKETPLRRVIAVLDESQTPYAVIGGIAVQLHSQEPRTTLDIDLAVPAFADIPHDRLTQAGFEHEGRHEHSDNWRAPGAGSRSERTAIQFSAADVGIAEAVARAQTVNLGDLRIKLVTVHDLIVLKLAAAEEPRRRPSKRRQDLLDVVNLAEEHPDEAEGLTDLAARIQTLVGILIARG
jgi:predicted nucleotidyltransferase